VAKRLCVGGPWDGRWTEAEGRFVRLPLYPASTSYAHIGDDPPRAVVANVAHYKAEILSTPQMRLEILVPPDWGQMT
jgi:hypothetical protein